MFFLVDNKVHEIHFRVDQILFMEMLIVEQRQKFEGLGHLKHCCPNQCVFYLHTDMYSNCGQNGKQRRA